VVFYGAILIYTIYFEYVAVGQQITKERCVCNLNSFIYRYFRIFFMGQHNGNKNKCKEKCLKSLKQKNVKKWLN